MELGGVLIALISAVVAYRAQEASTDVSVSIDPRPYEAQLFTRAVLEVQIVNDSARPTNLVGGRVLSQTEPVAEVDAVVRDINALGAADRFRLTDVARGLPVTIAPGAAVLAALVLAPRPGPALSRFEEEIVRTAPSRFPREDRVGESICEPRPVETPTPTPTPSSTPRAGRSNPPVPSPPPSSPVPPPPPPMSPAAPKQIAELGLELDFEPGGTEDADVAVLPGSGLLRRDLDNPDVRPGWVVLLEVLKSEVRAFAVARPSSEPPAVATVRLWQHGRGQLRPISRPVQSLFTCIPLGELRRGSYEWAMEVGARTVAVGRFATPCRVPEVDEPTRAEGGPSDRKTLELIWCESALGG